MEMIDQHGTLFKNIFPDYNSFKDYYLSTPLSDNEDDVPSEKTFTLIAFRYNDSHSSRSVESFKQQFSIDIYTFYKEFEQTTKSIDELMKLTDDEISIADTMITNFADTPETRNTTNAETADYISNQQKTINKKGNLQVKKEQVSNKRIYTVKTFLGRFKHLFVNVLSPSYNFVVSEPDRE